MFSCVRKRAEHEARTPNVVHEDSSEEDLTELFERSMRSPVAQWRVLKQVCARKPQWIAKLPENLRMYMAAEVGLATLVRDFGVTSSNVNTEFAEPYEKGTRLIHVLARAGHEQQCRELLDLGADLDVRNIFGETPLFLASERGHAPVAQLFADRGANVNLPNSCREVPLYAAAYHGHVGVIKVLVAAGCDPSVRSEEELTPLLVCQSRGYPEAANIIREALASIAPSGATSSAPAAAAAAAARAL